jgi:hypothetical protein
MRAAMVLNDDPETVISRIVVGPVLTRKGGYAFDCWTSEDGLSRLVDLQSYRRRQLRAMDAKTPRSFVTDTQAQGRCVMMVLAFFLAGLVGSIGIIYTVGRLI